MVGIESGMPATLLSTVVNVLLVSLLLQPVTLRNKKAANHFGIKLCLEGSVQFYCQCHRFY